ncbi:MAG: hypothetical protein ABR543_04155 [Gemmatimonadaceae bacterium]
MMGALLLPRPLVYACLQDLLIRQGLLGSGVLPDALRNPAARLLSDVFDVNLVVAQIRVRALYPQIDPSQLTL